MTGRISRDAYGLKLAEAAALRADCTRRQVGAVIIAEDGSIVSTGYNGLASGLPGCASAGACPRGQMSYADQPAGVGYAETSCDAAHAELNAVIRAGRERCKGATIYITDAPCHGCRVVIAAAGLARTVFPDSNPAAEIPTPPMGPRGFMTSAALLGAVADGVIAPETAEVALTKGGFPQDLYDALVRMDERAKAQP